MARNAHRGYSQPEIKEFEEEVLQLSRVTRVVAGGRRMRFRATVVIGNRKGKVGLGTGKAAEVTIAIQKAILQAKKKLITIPIFKDTIPHETSVKFKSAKLLLIPAGPGTGIIAGGPARKILELAGIKNILAKCLGAPNKLNNSYATMEALEGLKAIAVPEKHKAPAEKSAPAAEAKHEKPAAPKKAEHPTKKSE